MSPENVASCRIVLIENRAVQLLPVLDKRPALTLQHEDLFTASDLEDISLNNPEVPFDVDTTVIRDHLLCGLHRQAEWEQREGQREVSNVSKRKKLDDIMRAWRASFRDRS